VTNSIAQSRTQVEGVTAAPSVVRTLAPIMVVVLVAYLIIGLAMPVLPLYVHQRLGLSTFMVGLAAGVEFAAALVSRFWSGRYADTRGAKRRSLPGCSLARARFPLSRLATPRAHPATAIAVLLLGRVVLGGSESFVITGALSWGSALGGDETRTGDLLGGDGAVGRLRGRRARRHGTLWPLRLSRQSPSRRCCCRS